jgi:hypothetical protein
VDVGVYATQSAVTSRKDFRAAGQVR